MKKLLTFCGLVLLSLGASAQMFEPHVGIGVGVGTTGIAIDAGITLNDYLGVRGGVDIMPKFKVNKDIDLGTAGVKSSMSELTEKAKQINKNYNSAHGLPVDEMKGVIDLTNPIFNQQLPERMDIQAEVKDDKYVVCTVSMSALQLTEQQAATLFSPSIENIPYLLCRQIVRDHGEATNLRGCAIRAEVVDNSTLIIITLPRIWKISKSSS